MSKLAQLRERRNAKAKSAADINAKYPADKPMPAEDAAALDAVLAEVEQIDAEIAREVRLSNLAGEEIDTDDLRNRHTRTPGAHGNREEGNAMRAFLGGGLSALSQEQRAALQARITPDISNVMSTTTSTEGGFTVATEYDRTLETAMRSYGGLLDACTLMTTSSGALMNFPTADATSEEGEIVGENQPTSSADTTFGNVSLSVYKYSSKSIALPFELLQDSFLDIEAYVRDLIAMRLGRIANKHASLGTGTGQPRGIVPAATVGKTGATGQTLTCTYDDLVDLEHSVDPIYRAMRGVGFMVNDQALRMLRKIKDSQGRPIFAPGYEAGNPGGAPDRLLNRPIYVNNDLAAPAANARSILFGVFGKYRWRRVSDTTLFRMTDSAYTLKGQVGFVAFNRMGGNLVDAGGAIKAYQHSAS